MSRRTTRLAFDAIAVEGGLFTPDFLATVAKLQATGQSAGDYKLPKGLQVRDEISRAWRIAEAHWRDVESVTAAGSRSETATLNLITAAFGWNATSQTAPLIISGRSFPISARASEGLVPIVVAPSKVELDDASGLFGDGIKRRSPFGLLQEYLNADASAVWGICTNGMTLRIVRDNASLTRPSWIEIDLARIMREQRFAEFSLVWLLLHESRFLAQVTSPHESIIERWRKESFDAGTAARDRLRDSVEDALKSLGNGFLAHPANATLREKLVAGSLDAAGYHQQLLRAVYRLIFLLVAEERGLLHAPDASDDARALYDKGYSIRSLREKAARRRTHDRHDDVWRGVQIVFGGCAQGEPLLGISALGGLFSPSQSPDLDGARLGNEALLGAVFRLGWLEDHRALVRVNWRDMGTEELGSVYESLLELVPVVRDGARTYGFVGDSADEGGATANRGHARKLTGSYYTPDSLVQALLDSALDPVINAAASKENPEQAILSLAVLDPACGSAHFLLGAGRRIAARLARIRVDGTPSPAVYRTALRDVVTHCVYGSDKNAMAIELARIALWLEAMEPGRALAFLDHHLIHGDAILGVMNPSVMVDGIPDEAFSPLAGDDKEVAKMLKKANATDRKAIEKERKREQVPILFTTDVWAKRLAAIDAMPDETLAQIASKEKALRDVLTEDAGYARFAQDAYVAAFLMRKDNTNKDIVPTTLLLRKLAVGIAPSAQVREAVEAIARTTPFLHWSIAFAPVMARGGFDCVLGNPPWERVKLSEKEFFQSRDERISSASNKGLRQDMIDQLSGAEPGTPGARLFEAFTHAKREIDAGASFARTGGRFPLTGAGTLNLYALFAETAVGLITLERGAQAGLVLPSGIASDEGTAAFFRTVADGRLISLIDFENREALFAGVHRSFKFCLLTIGQSVNPTFAFFLTNSEQRFDTRRTFTLTLDDLRRINPNTLTAPTFRSNADAKLTNKIYRNVPVLWDETRDDGNPWGLALGRMFHMSDDAALFSTEPGAGLVPLYEAKMIHQYDHRWATYESDASRDVTEEEKADPEFRVRPRYWVSQKEVEAHLGERGWKHSWLLGWRNITNATNERTVIAAIFPRMGVGNSLALMFPGAPEAATAAACLLANLSSLVLDFAARQKIGGTNLNFFIAKQLPVLPPSAYDESFRREVVSRVALLLNASDLAGFRAELAECDMRVLDRSLDRATVRAEIDSLFAHRYGLTRDELQYILDPALVKGDDYPSESFRVLKTGEIATFGEFRTQRLVLEAWDRLFGTR